MLLAELFVAKNSAHNNLFISHFVTDAPLTVEKIHLACELDSKTFVVN